ncbi:tumor necrosis factor alpha-induced protein 2-like [Eucyclogobius newberryi]|uniref:tumor necrosis factor alpha-induced protein 2-like n=1 Tax=Eucyclogobius newberryi TaxID=166745 RepID=UPI003B5BAE85
MTEEGLSDEDQTQLHQDLDTLWTQIRAEVQKSFGPDFHEGSLRAAVKCILQQEEMDSKWLSLDPGLVPVWRPNRTLLDHNEVLGHMVQACLSQRPLQDGAGDKSEAETASAAEGELKAESEKASKQDSLDVTICRLAAQMREDLLYVQKTVSPCYPEHMNILQTYLLLYHRCFSSRLEQLANAPLDNKGLSCLLHWANHSYPREVVDPELEGKVDTDSLGPLLPTELVQTLQEQYLTFIQECLQRALKFEQELWDKPSKWSSEECSFPQLASDVLQMLVALQKVISVGPEQSQTIPVLLDSFLCRYVEAVEEFVKGNHINVASMLKAQLVCEEQFREFVLNHEIDEQKKLSCLNSLNALRDCGYCSLTSGIRSNLKEYVTGMWTGPWLDGSLPVMDSLLDFVDQKLDCLSDLKPCCAQWLLGRLHRDVALRYFKNLLKTKRRRLNEQVAGANRMTDDVNKMDAFFTKKGSDSGWVSKILLHVAEVLRLQDPDSIQLELVFLVQLCPDLSSPHVCRLLLLKSGLSTDSIRAAKCSVEENRPLGPPTNCSPPFFSHLKVKWIKVKMSQFELNTCGC